MSHFTHYAEHTGARAGKHHKATLFQGQALMVGLNCLEPGQSQPVHDHADADKVYVVMEGQGRFTVGAEVRAAGAGDVVFAPAGVAHGVLNDGAARLTLLVCIAPPPGG
jgi:quercetin dioxygenase-like cupin family protein